MSPSRSAALLLLLLAPVVGAQDPVPPVLERPVDRPPTGVAVHAPGAAAADLEQAVLVRRDPAAARQVLERPETVPLRTADPAAFQRLFEAAAQVRDVEGVVKGMSLPDGVRNAFLARPPGCFCHAPGPLIAWFDLYVDGSHHDRRDTVREAELEWDRMPPAARGALAARRADWPSLDLGARFAALKAGYADLELAALLALVPNTRSQFAALERRADELRPLLTEDDSERLIGHVAQARALVNGLEDAARRLGRGGDPRLAQMLADARAAGSVNEALSRLGTFFDGLGTRNTGVDRERPSTASEALDPGQRALLASLLRTGLQRAIAGTTAGDEIVAFYRTTPLNLHLEPAERYTGAYYTPGTDDITINLRSIEEFARVRGRRAADVLSDPALLQQLSWLLAPVLVHEATHHRQDRWEREHGLPIGNTQEAEEEAYQTQAVFTIEKTRRDPAYLAFLQGAAPLSIQAAGDLRRVDEISRYGLSIFRLGIASFNYPTTPSLEGRVWISAPSTRRISGDLAAELRRRQGLPAAEQASLESGPDFPSGYMSDEQWARALAVTGTAHLRRQEQIMRERLRTLTPEGYAAWRGRFDAANERAQGVLDMLSSGEPPERGGVPSPIRSRP